MSKLILDTAIYIDYFNASKYQEWVSIQNYPDRIYLSAIVLMELFAGAPSSRDIELLGKFQRPFTKRNMIVVPHKRDYIRAGKILATLQREKGYELKKAYWLTNDVLIAMSTRRVGATLVTKNRTDYEAIQEYFSFNLQVIN